MMGRFWASAWIALLRLPLAGQQGDPLPRQLFEEAIHAQQRGDDADALSKYRRILKLDPDAIGIRVNLGVTLAHMGRFDEAIEQYRLVLSKEPENRPVILNLASSLKEKGDASEAIKLLEPLHASRQEDPEAAMLLGECYFRVKRFKESVAVLTPIASEQPENLDLSWILGSALIGSGQTLEGAERIEKLAAKAGSAEAYLLAGQTRLKRDEYDLARRDADAALAISSKLAGARTLDGMILQHTGDLDGAASALREALDVNPDDFNAHLYLGAILYFKRDLRGARLHLERALAIQPNAPRVRYEIALVYKSEGHLESAVGELETLCRENPDWLDPHVELAALYYRVQRPVDGAREHQIVDHLMQARQQQGTSPQP